ncbi:MAG: hypothetical protein ACLVF4_09490 [Ruminococcus sp.]
MSEVCKRCGQPLPNNGLVTYVNKHTGRITKKHESYCKACKKMVRSEYYEAHKSNLQDKTGAARKQLTPSVRHSNVNDCYVNLAAYIVRSTMVEYEHALQGDDGTPESLHRIETIEDDLLSPYYSFLTLQVLDLRQYCVNKRRTYRIGTCTKPQDMV